MDPKVKRRLGRRDRRRSTNVFSGMSQTTIQTYREVFNMVDQDGDGHICKDDLQSILSSLGTEPTEEILNEMMSQCPGGPINFTSFLTMFANRTSEMDSDEVIRNALIILDEDGTGNIDAREFATLLHTVGYERLSQEEVALLLRKAPINDGMLNIKEFANILTFENVFNQ